MVESESSSSDDENPVEPAPTPTGVQKNFKKWKNVPDFGSKCGPFIPTKMFSRFDNHGHTTRSFLEKNKEQNIGLLIDLSKEVDPYDSNFGDAIEYVKHPAVSKEIPAADYVKTFLDVVEDYRGRHPDRSIATHCHYGFNRTGFMICSYLCSKEGMSPLDAIERFAKARPPGIKHEHFRRELITRFGAPHGQRPAPFDAEAEAEARRLKQAKKARKKERRARKRLKLASGDSTSTALASAPNSPRSGRKLQGGADANGSGGASSAAAANDEDEFAHHVGKPNSNSSSISSSLLSKKDDEKANGNGGGGASNPSSSSTLTPLLASLPLPTSASNGDSLPSTDSSLSSETPPKSFAPLPPQAASSVDPAAEPPHSDKSASVS